MVGTCDPEIDSIYVPCPPQNVPQVSVVTLCERPTFIIAVHWGTADRRESLALLT